MNHIESRFLNPNEFGGIGKDARCYFNAWDKRVLALVGNFRGKSCFIAQAPLPIQDVEFIVNDYMNRKSASQTKIRSEF